MTGTTHTARQPSADDAPTAAAVVRAVADQAGTDPLALPPLYHAIDPDVLDELFAPTDEASRRGAVSFDYAGHHVEIAYRDGDRSIDVRPHSPGEE